MLVLGGIGSAGQKPETAQTANVSPSAATAATSPAASITEAQSGEPTSEISSEPSPTTEATPEPTPVPTPEATPKPTPMPTPAGPILKTAGRGDKIVKFAAQDGPTFAKITGKGGGNFAVISYAGSEYGDLLVNEIGSYGGSVYIAPGINRLQVTSSGSWTIEIFPITSAKHWNGESSLSGKGDSVVNLTGWPSGITTIKNTSRSNFAVLAYSPEGDYLDLLVNEIGSYSGEVLLPEADPMVLVIQDVGGAWSLSAVQQ